jgi:hypothetical protein
MGGGGEVLVIELGGLGGGEGEVVAPGIGLGFQLMLAVLGWGCACLGR